MTRQFRYVALLAIALCAPAWAIDVWDASTEDDNGTYTDNVLVHGMVQVHDLGAEAGVADEDWFLVPVPPYSSVEVTVEGLTGDVDASSILLRRFASDGTMVLQSALQIYNQTPARRMAWRNDTEFIETHFVRVGYAGCNVVCTSNDQYTIRLRETQVALARFNNSGAQLTVLLVQNPSSVTIDARVYFWSSAGTLLATHQIDNLGPKQLAVVATQTIVAGQSGSMTIAHNGPHSGINAKAVALEPSTGFSFDTPGVIRP